jgi:hypothetical protein
MIFIAIGELNPNNGLPTSAKVEKLGCGEDMVVDGDTDILFSGEGGGLALLLIVDKED